LIGVLRMDVLICCSGELLAFRGCCAPGFLGEVALGDAPLGDVGLGESDGVDEDEEADDEDVAEDLD
jgi:hypothetical protein